MSDTSGTLLQGTWTDERLSERLLDVNRAAQGKWLILLLLSAGGTLLLLGASAYTLTTGIGVWGNNIPVGWAFAITNFVWWVGIGHAGTFISAVLLLVEQDFRSALNRIAESMTLFALAQAALYPLLHMGRAWFFYWLIPYPSTMDLWPQFLSVLTWDVVALTTYGIISLLFWYLGLIPDLATARDHAQSLKKKRLYGLFALGFCGSTRQWRHHRVAQVLLACLATPLVFSVHSIVSMDFATSQVAGWHSTIFPPYFVAGAIYSGLAMVLTIVVPLRHYFGLHDLITERHFDLVSKLLLLTGMLVAYSYVSENFVAWWSGLSAERHMFFDTRPTGAWGVIYWTMLFCNVVAVQVLWWSKARRSAPLLLMLSIVINVGMWLERLLLVVSSQTEGHLPSSWGAYLPTPVDVALFLGTLSFFAFLTLLVIRYLPYVPIFETKELARKLGRLEK